jgi:hypothetical protein
MIEKRRSDGVSATPGPGYAHYMTALAATPALAALFDRPAPFATVYLDASRNTEAGAQEVELRWRAVRDALAGDGADDETLDALAAAATTDVGAGPHGLVLVAAGGEVCFADRLPRPPATSTGRLAPLPHLMPYLAQRTTDVPHVVVVTDRTGADILTVAADGSTGAQSVEGSADYPLHRTATVDWSERHFQQRVENSWESNAKDVASAATRHIKELAAPLVVVAGDVRARSLVADELRALAGPHVEISIVEEGGRAAGSSAAALEAAVHEQVLRSAWRQRREVLEHLRQNLGRGEYAVAGVTPVVEALRKAQADTVVLSDDPSSTLTAWLGPQPTDFGLDDGEAAALGVPEPTHDRFDAALVRAVIGTGARLLVTPGAHDYLPEGIGALLRYSDLTLQ